MAYNLDDFNEAIYIREKDYRVIEKMFIRNEMIFFFRRFEN